MKGNLTRERGLRSHARRNFTANLTPTDKANEWLLGEKNARGTIHNYPSQLPVPLINRQLHYLEEAMKITKAWPAEEEEEEEAVRKGFADAGCSIRPLKRAKDGDDDEWETPSPTQKPRREGLGEGHWLRTARNLRRDAVDTGDSERG